MTTPHCLYKVIPGKSYQDNEGNHHTEEPKKVFLCKCFLHDLSLKEKQGFAGIGLEPKFYVNMNRRYDLEYGNEVEVYENGRLRGKGSIVDIKHTSIVGNYTVIYI